jgi:hypothetical protein
MIKYASCALLLLVLFSSCASVSKTALLEKASYRDTIPFSIGRYGHLVIPTKVNGVNKILIFDTGAFISMLSPNSAKKSKKKKLVRNTFGKHTLENLLDIDSIEISDMVYKRTYAIPNTLPPVFEADGLLGYNVIKASNWQISPKLIVVSNEAFFIQPKVTLPLFEKNEALHLNISLNNKKAEAFLIDYGGDFDIELSERFYNRNKGIFTSNSISQNSQKTYGFNGSKNQQVQKLNCSIDFEGVKIENVNITVKKGIKNRLGMAFLNRFKTIAINNSKKEMSFGELK